jgi:hypothetical protein
MNMNKNVMGNVAASALCCGTAGLGSLGAIKLQNKITGKPVGCQGSVAHIITNDKIEDKFECFKEINKEGAKDALKLTTVSGLAAGAGALATVASPKAKSALKSAKTAIGNALSNVSISGKSVKDIIKNTNVFTKFNSLPAPAKAAIAIGGAVLAAGFALFEIMSAAKAGYIEAKHEVK